MDIETFEDILNEYTVSYKIMCDYCGKDIKGRINYESKFIYLNPVYNDFGETITHEIYHHYFDNILGIHNTEQMVENESQLFYSDNKDTIEGLIEKCIEECETRC